MSVVICFSSVASITCYAEVDGWGLFNESRNHVMDKWPLIYDDESRLMFSIVSMDPPQVFFVNDGYDQDYTLFQRNLTVPERITWQNIEFTTVGVSLNIYNSDTENLTLPGTVRIIEPGNFYRSETLKSLVLPANLELIEEDNFVKLNTLKSIELPGTVHYIKSNCFNDNAVLEELTLNEGLLSFGDGCFNDNPKIKEVTLPQTLRSFGDNCFNDLPELRKVKLSRWFTQKRKPQFNEDGFFDQCFEPLKGCFCNCPNIEEIEITRPNSMWEDSWFKDVNWDKCIVVVPDGCLDFYNYYHPGKIYIEKSHRDKQLANELHNQTDTEKRMFRVDGTELNNEDFLHQGEVYVVVSGGKSMKHVK